MKKPGFTLIELLVAIIIVCILGTLAITHYAGVKERTLDKEAQANLKLISAAERIWKMESDNQDYVACSNTTNVNNNLKMLISTTNPAWNYSVSVCTVGTITNNTFTAQAIRTNTPVRYWCMYSPTTGTPDPQPVAQTGACACP